MTMISAGSTIRPCACDIETAHSKRESDWRTTRNGRVFIGTLSSASKCWRRINPQQPSLRPAGILPAVRSRTIEIEAVATFKNIMFLRVEPNLKIPAHDMQEFLAFMRVGFTAAPSGFDAEKMRLHHRVSPGQQLHAHFRRGFQDFSLIGAHQPRIIARRFEERKNVGAVEAGDAAQRGNRGAHLATLEGAEKAHGHTGGASHLRQGEAAAGSQAAETLSREQ